MEMHANASVLHFLNVLFTYSMFTMLLNSMPEITQIQGCGKKAAASAIKHSY